MIWNRNSELSRKRLPEPGPDLDTLDAVRLALRRVRRLARGLQDVWSERQRAGLLAQIASIHESIALPKGQFGRVAVDLASDEAGRASDDIDIRLEALRASPIRSPGEWKSTVADLILRLERLAESEESRLSAASCTRTRRRLADSAWSPHLVRLLESDFFELKRQPGNPAHFSSPR